MRAGCAILATIARRHATSGSLIGYPRSAAAGLHPGEERIARGGRAGRTRARPAQGSQRPDRAGVERVEVRGLFRP